MADDSNKKKHFFKDMRTELKKVNWLTPKQLLNNTTAVVVMVVIVTAIVFVLDLTFDKVNEYGVEGLKSIVQRDATSTDIVADEEVATSTEVIDVNQATGTESSETETVEADN